MKKTILLTLAVLIGLVALPTLAQRPAPPPVPQRPVLPEKREFPTMPPLQGGENEKKFEDNADDVVKVDTTLVQVDAVVLDKTGNLVPHLKLEDFQILQDGKPQRIEFFSYVSSSSGSTGRQKNIPKVPLSIGSNINVDTLKRTIAFVVDDTCMSFESINSVRAALMEFVDSKMLEGDLVGIFRTRSGNGMLQQFTSDKSVLVKGIKAITLSNVIGCQDAFYANRSDYLLKQNGQGGATGFQDEASRKSESRINDLRRESASLGTVKTLEYLVRGMQTIPGRKSMILLSDGIFSSNQNTNQASSMRRLVNFANQSAVVIYTINSKGLFDSSFISAADEVLPFSGDGGGGNDIEKLITKRGGIYQNGLDGLRYLAYSTSGTFVDNSNDLNKGIGRILDDQKGYYLIGYQPDESASNLDSNFRKVKVMVRQADLTVRHRFGFYGVISSKAQEKLKSKDSALYKALISPLAEHKLRLKFTAFVDEKAKNSGLRYVIHLDANDITIKELPNGTSRLSLDIVAALFGPDGKLADEFNHTNNALIKGGNMEQLRKNGITYTGEFNLKKAGVYQVRVAIRDGSTGNIGTVSQFIDIPDPDDKALTLSQVIISGESETFPPVIPPFKKMEEALTFSQSATEPSIRKFVAGSGLGYGYTIHNPGIDPKLNRPSLTSELKIYKDGSLLYGVNEAPVDIASSSNIQVKDSGVIPLKSDMRPGIYAFQVIVRDKSRNSREVMQWIDFEVVN